MVEIANSFGKKTAHFKWKLRGLEADSSACVKVYGIEAVVEFALRIRTILSFKNSQVISLGEVGSFKEGRPHLIWKRRNCAFQSGILRGWTIAILTTI